MGDKDIITNHEDSKPGLKDFSNDELYENLNVKRKQLHEKVKQTWGEDERNTDEPLLSLSRDVDDIVNELHARKLDENDE